MAQYFADLTRKYMRNARNAAANPFDSSAGAVARRDPFSVPA
jgi:hypothetical protein